MSDNQTNPAQEDEPLEQTPAQTAQYWLDQIQSAERKKKPFIRRGRQIVRRFKNRKGDAVSASLGTTMPGGRRMNVLWSNVQTQQPVLFSQTPKANVSRRNKTKDPVGRTASIVLQNCLQNSIGMEDFDFIMGQVVQDRLLPGAGLAMVEYVPEIKEDKVGWQAAQTRYIHWEDWLTNVARVPQEVWFWAYRVFLTKDECAERAMQGAIDAGKTPEEAEAFALNVRENITLDHKEEKAKDGNAGDRSQEPNAKAVVWCIWDRNKSQVLHVATGYPDAPLAVLPPPVSFDEFFPAPRPLQATTTTDSTYPVADFEQYVDQADEIDLMTQRIGILSQALRLRGLYPADMDALKQLMDGGDADMIPYDEWQRIEQGGGIDKLVLWFPIEAIAATLVHCYEVRDQAIKTMYEITGISDIMRGDTEASETATAQQLKAQFGGVRVRESQKDVQRFIRDLLRRKAEIICEHFEVEVIKKMSGVKLLTQAEKMQVQKVQQAQAQFAAQQQQIAQQAQAQGIQPPPPAQSGIPQPPPEILEAMREPTWEEVMGLLRDEKLRGFVVDVETDSTIEPDQRAQQQAASEFTAAVAQFLSAALPIMQAAPQSADFLGEMLIWTTQRWKGADTIESAVEEFIEQMKKQAEQPKQPGPDEMKAQAEVMKAQASVKVAEIGVQQKQLELEADMVRHRQEMEKMAFEAANPQLRQEPQPQQNGGMPS